MAREPPILSADSPVSRASTPLIVLSRAPCAGALGPLWEGGSSSHRLHTHRLPCPGVRYQTHNWFLQLLATMERGEGGEDDYPNGFFSLPALNAGIDRLSQGFQDVFF